MAKKTIPCPNPECDKVLKSSSGWTLHVKKCCPELRWRKTIVKMEVEFEIPDVVEEGISPVALFRKAFWTAEVRGIGTCALKHATLLDRTTATRSATQQEKKRMGRAEALRDRNSAANEFKKIVKEIVGEAPKALKTSTQTEWPETIMVTFHKPGINRWEIRNTWEYAFTLHLKKTTLEVQLERRALTGKWGVFTTTKSKTFQLADPKSFEGIRKFTGLQP